MTDVWSYSEASGTNLLVLLALADIADDEGVAWPSMAHIARKCRVDTRTARRRIRSLEELGEVFVIEGGGKSSSPRGTKSNLYRITVHMTDDLTSMSDPGMMPDPGTNDREGRAQAPGGSRALTPGGSRAQVSAYTSVEPSVEPSLVPASPKRRKQQISADFALSQTMVTWCTAEGIRSDPVTETTKFIDHHRSKGSTFADPMAAWRNWMRKADEYGGVTHSLPARQSRSMQAAALPIELLRAREARQEALAQ